MKITLTACIEKFGSPVKVEEVNTNNDWGFGGWSGTRSTFANGHYHETLTIMENTRHTTSLWKDWNPAGV